MDVFTRRDSSCQPIVVEWVPGVRVINVPAGPPIEIAKELLLPYMQAFSAFVQSFVATGDIVYEAVHANFFMSGWVMIGSSTEVSPSRAPRKRSSAKLRMISCPPCGHGMNHRSGAFAPEGTKPLSGDSKPAP